MSLDGPKFTVGQRFFYDGIEYEILGGNRCDGDMIIRFRLPGGAWCTPTIAHSLILLDFKYQVEENNYGENGKIQRASGGWYLIGAVIRALREVGWQKKAEEIRAEVEKAKRKRLGGE